MKTACVHTVRWKSRSAGEAWCPVPEICHHSSADSSRLVALPSLGDHGQVSLLRRLASRAARRSNFGNLFPRRNTCHCGRRQGARPSPIQRFGEGAQRSHSVTRAGRSPDGLFQRTAKPQPAPCAGCGFFLCGRPGLACPGLTEPRETCRLVELTALHDRSTSIFTERIQPHVEQ